MLSVSKRQSLSYALVRLGEEAAISEEEAGMIIAILKETLLDEDAEYEWGDAYDALRRFGPRHKAAIRFLQEIVAARSEFKGSQGRYLVEWSEKAIKKIEKANKRSWLQRFFR